MCLLAASSWDTFCFINTVFQLTTDAYTLLTELRGNPADAGSSFTPVGVGTPYSSGRLSYLVLLDGWFAYKALLAAPPLGQKTPLWQGKLESSEVCLLTLPSTSVE